VEGKILPLHICPTDPDHCRNLEKNLMQKLGIGQDVAMW
jgi:hypothetical protein